MARQRSIVLAALAAVLAVGVPQAAATATVTGPAGTAIDSPAPPAEHPGPRAAYEARLGHPPRVVQPTGHLGHAWRGQPPYIVGQPHWDRGEFILNDHPFDDTGADTVPDSELAGGQLVYRGLCGSDGAYKHGEHVYPAGDAYRGNAADIVEVRLTATERDVHVVFLLETLVDPGTTAVALGIDADLDSATDTAGWGGYEHLLVVTSDGARLDGEPVASHVDVEANTFEARWPRGRIPLATWGVAAVAALRDGDGIGTVTDLAYNGDESALDRFNCWFDQTQAAHIADGSYPALELDAALLGARTDAPPTTARGALVRLHAPTIDIGEGVVGQPRYGQEHSQKIHRGVLQPYAVFVPDDYDPAQVSALVMLLHCLTCNHATYLTADGDGLRRLAETLGAVVVMPLAYGGGGHYEGEAEHDVFDVLADARARYRIDADRIYLAGMSMGALGTYRLALLYPDLWAAALGVGNYTNPFCVSPVQSEPNPCGAAPFNYFSVLDNARNVPFALVNGVLDELTPVTGARQIADRLDELRYVHAYWELPTRRHEADLVGQTADVTGPWLRQRRRVADPASVTYLIDTAMAAPEWGIVHDRAYWIRDIRVAEGERHARVDAVSGRGRGHGATEVVAGSGQSDAGPYTLRGRDARFTDTGEANQLTVTVSAVASLRIDGPAAGLRGDQPLSLTVTTDRAIRVHLPAWSAQLELAAGTHELIVPPTGRDDPAPAGDAAALPATGGGPPPGVGVIAATAAVVLLRRRHVVTLPRGM